MDPLDHLPNRDRRPSSGGRGSSSEAFPPRWTPHTEEDPRLRVPCQVTSYTASGVRVEEVMSEHG